ncbi:MFS transporter [Saxibacter everestensis]|uniref:MFS transporter n=1 Tax=Saxibacter everestensis TaxID=2909229 RepID=A0ABY8QWZ8_9MICO|nr:MFS transporter [Brevibacteriaceae bacterium ZFBP1038]
MSDPTAAPHRVSDSNPAATLARPGLLIVGILLVAANLRAGLTVVGPLLGEVRADLGLTSVAGSALISLPVLCFAVFSPFAPPLAKRLGMERTLGLSLAVLAVGIVLRSVPWLPALWIGTVLLGIAIATANVILPALLKRDFPGNASRLTGVYSAMQSAMAAAASGLAVPLAGLTPSGWRLAFGLWAGAALIALAVFSPQLRRRTVPAIHDHAPLSQPARFQSPWRHALGWQVSIFMGTQSTLFYVVLTWWPSIEESNGVLPAVAGFHQGLFQLCGIAGSLITAALLHRWHRDQRGTLLLFAPLPAAAILGQLFLPELAILWNALLGLSAGATLVLALALFSLRTGHHAQAAALSGMAQSVGYLLAAAGPILLGALHDATGSWTWPLITLLALQVVQFISGYLSARNRTLP